MAKKQVGSKPRAGSALGPIAHALIQGYLGPARRAGSQCVRLIFLP
jgi:hypothetical protein